MLHDAEGKALTTRVRVMDDLSIESHTRVHPAREPWGGTSYN